VEALDPDEPALHVLHLVLPHQPWTFLPSGVSYPIVDDANQVGRFVYSWEADADDLIAVQRQRHELQAMYADALVGQVLEQLRASDVYDDAVVAVVADHGISFTSGEPIRRPTGTNIHETAWVPLLVKAPGLGAGEVDDRDATVLDLVPTVADSLDIELPWEVDGRSLLSDPGEGDSTKTVYVMPAESGFDETTTVTIEAAAGLSRLLANAREAPEPTLLETGAWWAPEPFRPLVGRDIGELPRGPELDVSASVWSDGAFAGIDPASSVPAYVLGDLDGAALPDHVAVVVNGVVAAIAPVAAWSDHPHLFTAMVPQQYFVSGENSLSIFGLDESDPLVLRAMG
jgi:hypothetical protein